MSQTIPYFTITVLTLQSSVRSNFQGSKDGSSGTPCMTPYNTNGNGNRDSIGSSNGK